MADGDVDDGGDDAGAGGGAGAGGEAEAAAGLSYEETCQHTERIWLSCLSWPVICAAQGFAKTRPPH